VRSQKATINFVTCVCLYVSPHGTTQLPMEGFPSNLTFKHFLENVAKKFKFD